MEWRVGGSRRLRNSLVRLLDQELCLFQVRGGGVGRLSSSSDRIPSTTPGAEPPRDARDSGSARSHSTHLETSTSDRPKMVTYTELQTVSSYMSVKCTRRTLRMPNFTRGTHAQPSLSDFPWRDSDFWRADPLTRDDPGGTKFSHFPPK